MSYDPVKAGDKGDYYAEEQVYKKTWNLGIISTLGIVVALANFTICIWIRCKDSKVNTKTGADLWNTFKSRSININTSKHCLQEISNALDIS